MMRKAAVLAVGTELTTGQTVNSNASQLSAWLVDLGIDIIEHRTVADDRERIRESLAQLSGQSDLLIVTGGLGPTTDDFTREEIAQAAGRALVWNDKIWSQIHSRLSAAGIRVADANRQQCFFPEGALILPNPAGTAAGFRLKVGLCDWVVLPGPPREVEAIWRAGLSEWIASCAPGKKFDLLTWQCLGKSEAELGELTETALQGAGLLTGYRAHRPYIEIKVWVPSSRTPAQDAALSRLEGVLAPWIVQRPGELMPMEALLQALKQTGTKVVLCEIGLEGFLLERWWSVSRACPGVLVHSIANTYGASVGDPGLGLAPQSLGDAWISIEASADGPASPVQLRLRRFRAGVVAAEWLGELKCPFHFPQRAEEEIKKAIKERVLRWSAEAVTLRVKDWFFEEGITA